MKRRDFLGNTFLASITAAIAAPFQSFGGKNNTSVAPTLGEAEQIVYACESGIYGKDGTYVLGLLVIEAKQVELIEQQLLQYREEFKYKAKLTFSGNDANKEPIVKMMLNYFAKNEAMSFYATVIQSEKTEEGNPILADFQTSFGQKAVRKIEFFQQIAEKTGIGAANYVMKSQSPYGPSVFFKEKFNENIKALDFSAVNTLSSNLLQLSGILTGCVRSDIADLSQDKVRISIKNHLKEILELKSLAVGTDNKKIRIF